MPLTFHHVVIYVLCLVGLFSYSVFVLTLFSPRKKQYKLDKKFRPSVSVIVPIWNEGSAQGERLKKTIDSLLNCSYPQEKLEIIIVNDGSSDNSLSLANAYKKHGVKVFSHKKPRGKTLAFNTGLKHATSELVVGLDADSFIEPDVLDKLTPCFKDKHVMAAIPSVKIWKPQSWLQRIQFQEFLSAVFIRHVQSELGGVPLAPGAFTLIRKSFLDKYGSLDHSTMVEDLEMSLRIQSEHFLTENVIDANVYTSGVKTMKEFFRQRLRWFVGFMVQLKRYKHLFSKEYGNLGVFVLPVSVIYIFLVVFVFGYTVVMAFTNLVKWLLELQLIGFRWAELLEWSFDPFFLTINNTTTLPFLLVIIMFAFMYYIKRVSNEKQPILYSFLVFTFTYWFLGSLCWVLAIYYRLRGKKIKWGPNYFTV
jgi:cellulose synthase/poly-beta-1,6-N-acetylglucosamine synthase-like glycosyltransferase